VDEPLNTENKPEKLKRVRNTAAKTGQRELLTRERKPRKGKKVVYYKSAREPLLFFFYNYQRSIMTDFEFFCLILNDVI
jgi:hypothetical protein